MRKRRHTRNGKHEKAEARACILFEETYKERSIYPDTQGVVVPTGTEEKGREVEDRGMGKGIFGVCEAETESSAKKQELSTSSCNQLVVVAQNATTATMGDAKGNGDEIWDITCKLHVANFLCPRLAVTFCESFLEDSLDLYGKKCQSDKFRIPHAG